MSNFRPTDRLTGYLMPPSVDEWLPQRHLARFVVEVVEGLDLRAMSKAYRGSGSASYHPAPLLSMLIYGYATGVFSSRKLERATYDSVAFRFIAANDHPDHDTIATFRRRFLKEIEGPEAGARDGRAEDGHGGAGRDQDPRQRQPPQRAVV
jgi:transposase